MLAIWRALRSKVGRVNRVGVASLLLTATHSAFGAGNTAAQTSRTTQLALANTTTQATAGKAQPAKATDASATKALVAPKPAFEAKAAQLQLPLLRPEQVRVESVNPAVKAPAASALAGGTAVEVKQGEVLILHKTLEAARSSATTVLSATEKTPFTSTVVVGLPDRDNGTVARQFQPFLSADVSPLIWDEHSSKYATTVVVGLDPLAGEANTAVTLPSAIRVVLSGENLTSIEPSFVEIREAGADGYQHFRVLTGRFDQAVKVTAHSNFGDKSFEANVDPRPARIEIGRADATVDGFGLGTTTISVRQVAANKQPWPALAAQQIQLQSVGGGVLVPSSVLLTANSATGETKLVSAGWGEAVVSEVNASSDGASRATVEFAFPWLKFLLGFLGAALAGVLRVFTTEPGKRQGWGPVFVGCLASGIAVDILVALGAPLAPEWLLGMMRSELAWLVIGLVAGYPGVAVVAWLGEKLFAFKKPEPASAGASG